MRTASARGPTSKRPHRGARDPAAYADACVHAAVRSRASTSRGQVWARRTPRRDSTISAALLLFLILDPLGNIPVFLSLLKPLAAGTAADRAGARAADRAGRADGFLWGGSYVLELMHLRQESVSIAGGIVLFLIGLKMIFPPPGRHVRRDRPTASLSSCRWPSRWWPARRAWPR